MVLIAKHMQTPTEMEAQMGRKFQQIREQRGLSCQKVHQDTSALVVHLHMFEAGKLVPSYTFLAVLSAYLNVSADYFLGLIPEPRPPLEEGKKQWDEP